MDPKDIAEIQELVRSQPKITARGGGSKPALLDGQPGATRVELGALSGMREYQPDEFTFTALAGTPLGEIRSALAEHGQYLPFDPPLVEAGATLGGTVAAGLSGPGRYRYGGLRDFLLGVRFVDGAGHIVRSGGQVVKNAAGFDLPKLMAGSLGMYGVLVELSFKVFPEPPAYATLIAGYPSLGEALGDLVRLSQQPLELFALDLQPGEGKAALLARLGGRPEAMRERIERLSALLHSDQVEVLETTAEADLWRDQREFTWTPAGWSFAKAPLTPGRVLDLDFHLEAGGALRRYSAGANLAWVAWPGEAVELDAILISQQLSGLLLRGAAASPRLGVRGGEELARRVKRALDPQGKFPGV